MQKALCVLLPLFYTLLVLPVVAQQQLDIQGHRGCRGLMPENTLPAFIKAIELGVTTLDLDIVISADGQIVVSHQPWMSSLICTHPDGKPVSKGEEKEWNLYEMSYAEIQAFDCGSTVQEEFPSQVKIKVVKPTLKMVVKSVQRFIEENKYPQPRFSIELRSDPKLYGTFQPQPEALAGFVSDELRRLGIEEITTLQSSDVNVLEALYKSSARKFQIAYLVDSGKSFAKNLEKLSFKPDIYSPLYTMITPKDVKDLHEAGIRVIPWTINSTEAADQMIAMNVDGFITDYPDLFVGWSQKTE